MQLCVYVGFYIFYFTLTNIFKQTRNLMSMNLQTIGVKLKVVSIHTLVVDFIIVLFFIIILYFS